MSLKSVGKYDETTVVEIMDPRTGEPMTHGDKPMTITIYGQHSDHYRAISNTRQNARLQKAQRTGGKLNLTAEQIQSDSLNLLVKCVKDWFIVVDEDKGPEELSDTNVRKVFEDFQWVRQQVEDVMADDKAFLASSKTN